MLLNNVKWGLMDQKFNGEQHLRTSGIPFVIVRQVHALGVCEHFPLSLSGVVRPPARVTIRVLPT
jgi:GTP cyclohydrolase I